MKTCHHCKKEKALNLFGNSRRDGILTWCKDCRYKAKQDWRERNPDKVKVQSRRSDKKRSYLIKTDPVRYRKYRATQIRIKFGITIEEHDKKLAEQNGVCAICKRSIEMALCVDHDHVTGKVRGLLCHQCNFVIGNAEDNVNTLESAIKYLQLYKKI